MLIISKEMLLLPPLHVTFIRFSMTLRVSLIVVFSIAGILLLVGYLADQYHPDLLPHTFSLQTIPPDPSQGQPGVTINLPPVVAPVDDGQGYYYVQVNLVLKLDRPGTAGLIQARHDAIDRQVMKILHTYAVSDLRAAGQLSALRADIRRPINKLLPKGPSPERLHHQLVDAPGRVLTRFRKRYACRQIDLHTLVLLKD